MQRKLFKSHCLLTEVCSYADSVYHSMKPDGPYLSILTSSASTLSTKSLNAGRRLRRTMASLCSLVRPFTLGSDMPVRTISLPRRKCWNSTSYESSLDRDELKWLRFIALYYLWWYISVKLASHLVMPFRLILASSMAKVMWSWCSMPLAALLNTTYIPPKKQTWANCCFQSYDERKGVSVFKMCGSYLEEVLGDDGESLWMIADALEVLVLVQHSVVGIQEKVKRVLVQEVHLKKYTKSICIWNVSHWFKILFAACLI